MALMGIGPSVGPLERESRVRCSCCSALDGSASIGRRNDPGGPDLTPPSGSAVDRPDMGTDFERRRGRGRSALERPSRFHPLADLGTRRCENPHALSLLPIRSFLSAGRAVSRATGSAWEHPREIGMAPREIRTFRGMRDAVPPFRATVAPLSPLPAAARRSPGESRRRRFRGTDEALSGGLSLVGSREGSRGEIPRARRPRAPPECGRSIVTRRLRLSARAKRSNEPRCRWGRPARGARRAFEGRASPCARRLLRRSPSRTASPRDEGDVERMPSLGDVLRRAPTFRRVAPRLGEKVERSPVATDRDGVSDTDPRRTSRSRTGRAAFIPCRPVTVTLCRPRTRTRDAILRPQ